MVAPNKIKRWATRPSSSAAIRLVRTRLRSGFRNGDQKTSHGWPTSEKIFAAIAYATVSMKLKVMYEVDRVGVALCPDCHLGDRSGLHGARSEHTSELQSLRH